MSHTFQSQHLMVMNPTLNQAKQELLLMVVLQHTFQRLLQREPLLKLLNQLELTHQDLQSLITLKSLTVEE
jgi:hypothetical protein